MSKFDTYMQYDKDMSTTLLLLILISWSPAGAAIGGTLMSLFGWFLLIILLALIWEYKVYIFGVIFSLIAIFVIKAIISDYLKYKDETPEEREERLKTNRMIEKWRKDNNF